jgi:hypothetical protein
MVAKTAKFWVVTTCSSWKRQQVQLFHPFLFVYCLSYNSYLKMEAICSSETSQRTTRNDILLFITTAVMYLWGADFCIFRPWFKFRRFGVTRPSNRSFWQETSISQITFRHTFYRLRTLLFLGIILASCRRKQNVAPKYGLLLDWLHIVTSPKVNIGPVLILNPLGKTSR